MATPSAIQKIISSLKGQAKRILSAPTVKLSEEEKKFRQSNLNKMRNTIIQYKKNNPNFKVPREFKDLE